jgi:hypothetical protein
MKLFMCSVIHVDFVTGAGSAPTSAFDASVSLRSSIEVFYGLDQLSRTLSLRMLQASDTPDCCLGRRDSTWCIEASSAAC